MRIARLILLSVTFCLVGASVVFAETIATKDYWVLTDGYRAEFANNGEIAVSYGPYGSYIAEDVFDVGWPGTTGTTDQFFDYDAGRLVYYGARYVDSYGEYTYVPEVAQGFLPAALEVGKSYTCSWKRQEYLNGVYVGEGRDTYAVTVRGPLTTTVPAGTYMTYEMNLTNDWETSCGSRGIRTYTYYVAKGIGWVKLKRPGMTYKVASYAGPPAAPRLCVATSGNTLSISWTPVAEATGYTLFYAPYPGASPIGSIDMGTQTGGSFVLADGAAFYVAVQARNSYGSSGYSNIAYFVMSGSFSVSPTNLSLTVDQTGSCAVTGGVSPYNATSSNTSVAAVSVSGSTLTVRGVSTGSATVTVTDSASAAATVAVTVSGGTPSTYTNSLGQTFVLIPAGTFTMGSPSDEPGRYSDEGPQHQVTLTQAFYMQTTEVTQAQWEAVMGKNPSYFTGCPTCPVEDVSWNDAQAFVVEMNQRGEGTYRLPTEAQWEYAARAGSTTAFYNGGITETGSGDDPNLDVIGWYWYNSGSKTHPVGQKSPNAWGLYDMSGNVWEWVQDWYSSSYYASSVSTDPTGPSIGSTRVGRGGSWVNDAWLCRSANRLYSTPGYGYYSVGFRLLRQP